MMFGFNNKRKRNTIIGGGDFDRDGVKNVRDCEPLNWRKQDGGKVGIGDPAFVDSTDDLVVVKKDLGDSFIVDNNVNEYKVKKTKLRRAY